MDQSKQEVGAIPGPEASADAATLASGLALPLTDAQLANDLAWNRLSRCGYLVVPRLAIMAMPDWWQAALERLLRAADAAGLETPDYHVFRDDGPGAEYTRARVVNDYTGFVRLVGGRDDPWADYKYGKVADLCPGFDPTHPALTNTPTPAGRNEVTSPQTPTSPPGCTIHQGTYND